MSWWKTAKVGDKVVCVSLSTVSKHNLKKWPQPEVGSLYTIQSIEKDDWFSVGVGFHVGLIDEAGRRWFYDAGNFKPVEPSKRTTKTGMEILNDIRTHAHEYEVV